MKLLRIIVLFILVCSILLYRNTIVLASQPILEAEVIVETEKEVSENELSLLLNEVHEKIEGEDFKKKGISGFLHTWAKNFNFRRFAINAYRLYLQNSQNPKLREHTLNIVTMLSLSHMTEMLSGPVGIGIGSGVDAPETVLWLIGATGTLISIPGLDPLCVGLLLSYKYKPVQRTISAIRIVLIRSTHYVAKNFGLRALLNWMFQFQDPITFLVDVLDKTHHGKYEYFNEHLEKSTIFGFNFKNKKNIPYLFLQFKKYPNGEMYLKKLYLDHHEYDPHEKDTLARELNAFGWNIKDAVLAVINYRETPERLRNKIHIEEVYINTESYELDVSFKSFTLPWKKITFVGHNKKRAYRKVEQFCRGIFDNRITPY